MARFKPLFCATFLPGVSTVPRAHQDHVLDSQVLNGDQVAVPNKTAGGSLDPVSAPVHFTSAKLGD